MKKILSALLAAALILSLCACRESTDQNDSQTIDSQITIGITDEIKFGDNMGRVISSVLLNSKAWILTEFQIFSVDLETREIQTQEVSAESGSALLFAHLGEIKMLCRSTEESLYYIQTVGGEKESLDNLFDERAIILSAKSDAEGNCYFVCNDNVIVTDSSYNEITTYSENGAAYRSLAVSGSGEIYAGVRKADNSYILEKLGGGETIDISGSVVDGDGNFDLYLNDGENLIGLDIESRAQTVLVNWLDSGIISTKIMDTLALGNNRFAVVTGTEIILLGEAEVNMPDTKRTELTLATINADAQILQAVAKYNSSNQEYYITLKDYFDYSASDPWTEALNKLNLEIIVGDIPDIFYMFVPGNWPIETYSNKEIFENLYPYIDADPGISRDDLFSSILEASEHDGALYTVPVTYVVEMLMGHRSVFGDSDLTIDAICNYVGEHEGDLEYLYKNVGLHQGDLLSTMLGTGGGGFIDWENGICNFESKEFITLLNTDAMLPNFEYILKQLLENADSEGTNRFMVLKSGRVSNMLNYLSDVYDYGDDLACYGIPAIGEEPAFYADANVSIAISSIGKHKAEAWDFVKQFLYNEEMLTELGNGNGGQLPINRAAFDKLAEYWLSSEGSYEGWGEGVGYSLRKQTQEDVEFFRYVIDSVNAISVNNDPVREIVIDEAGALFAGAKSAAEVASIIQSRTKIYVAEQMLLRK